MPTPTFEETYPKAPFAELIRIAIALGRLLARWRDTRRGQRLPAETATSR